MRYDAEHKQKTRERVLDEAARGDPRRRARTRSAWPASWPRPA